MTKLFDRAVERVRSNPEFELAKMLEAQGTPKRRGRIHGTGPLANWWFVFVNPVRRSEFASVTIEWHRGEGFTKPKGHRDPWLEDVILDRAPKLTLREAVSLLEDAGYDRGFYDVVLRNPLGPTRGQPLYIFTLKRKHVAVNTKTREVAPIS